MLTIFRSNRAEWLAELLSEQLRLKPPAPLETVEVMVSTWPTSRWLSEKISSANGICAKVNFPFPTTHLRKFVQLSLGLEVTPDDLWKKNRLRWIIIDLLPILLEKNESAYLLNWLNEEISTPADLTKRKWELANNIATTFEEYNLYRPELICNWWEQNSTADQSINELPPQIRWQPVLLKLLKKKISQEPLAIQISKIKHKLKNGILPRENLPKELCIFGVSALPAIQVELLQALSLIVDIKIYLLTPCQDLWKRCRDRREELGTKWIQTLDESWLLNAPRIEASLGRMGAEFQQLLEGSGEYQLGEWQEKDLFAMPVKIAKNSSRSPSFLEQLQESLITSDSGKVLRRKSNDTSITFLSTPGKKRQVQVIRDQIIQWLAEDTSLEPKDILIMTPQIEIYAPLITSVFNDISATSVNLPWKITDRSQHQQPGLIKFILELMAIASNRLTANKLESLLSNQIIQEQFDINQEEVETMTYFLHRTGFRWGVDGKDRDGDETHSLSWCLERWALGIIFQTKPGFAPKGISPFSENFSVQQINNWTKPLSRIITCLKQFRSKKSCTDWVLTIKKSVRALFPKEGSWTWQVELLYQYLDEWKEVAGHSNLKLEITIVSEIIKESFALGSGRFGHRSGKITISALEPMRAIPHRVIILMGLDHSVFPRNEERTSFNLINNQRLLGDPSSTDRDRYVLLEALMSSRQKLLIAWNCRNEKTGEALEAPAVIHQWIEYLKSELDKDDLVGLVKKAPANPLSDENFIASQDHPPISCDKRNLDAKKWLNADSNSKSLAIAIPLKWDENFSGNNSRLSNEMIESWLKAPQIFWLEQMQIRIKERNNCLEDLESLQLDELQRFNLLNIQFQENKKFLSNHDELSKNTNWQQQLKGQGILPLKAAGDVESGILEARWESLCSLLWDIGKLELKQLELEHETIDVMLSDKKVVVVELGKLKPKSIMKSWLKHLQVCSYGNLPRNTILISRSSLYKKREQYEISAEFKSISKEDSLLILDALHSTVQQGQLHCWPIPPESGWEISKVIFCKKNLGHKEFKRKWLGSPKRDGESSKPEMRLCFGDNLNTKEFIESNVFKNCLNTLYKPLFDHLIKI